MGYIDLVWNYLKNPETREILKFIGGFIAALSAALWLIYTQFFSHSKKINEFKEIDISNGKTIFSGNNITNIININQYKEDNYFQNEEDISKILKNNTIFSKTDSTNFNHLIISLGDIAHRNGVLAELDKNYRKADDWFSQAVKLQPNNPRYLNSAGNIKRILGYYKDSEQLFKKAMEILGDYE
jgi:tetratricopeptide (TPR) repeat protein